MLQYAVYERERERDNNISHIQIETKNIHNQREINTCWSEKDHRVLSISLKTKDKQHN